MKRQRGGISMEPLESRVQPSASSPAPAPPQLSAPVSVRRATAAPTPGVTRADRQALIKQFSGTLAASLRKTLRHSGDAAFDASLLKYMVRRAGPTYFYNGRQLTRYAEYISRALPQALPNTLEKADAILDHRFPQQTNSETYTVQLGSKIDWDVAPKGTAGASDFLHTLNQHG